MVCLGFLIDRIVSSKSDLEFFFGVYDCVELLLNLLVILFFYIFLMLKLCFNIF